MFWKRSTTLAALVLALLAGHAAAPAAETASLTVARMRLRITPPRARRAPAHKAVLFLRLPAGTQAEDFDPMSADLEVRVGDVSVFSLSDEDRAAGLHRRGRHVWRFRAGRRGPRLAVDLSTGLLRVVSGRLDLSSLDPDAAHALPVMLRLGEQTFEATVRAEVAGKRWSLHRTLTQTRWSGR